jgi:hypothetical protein
MVLAAAPIAAFSQVVSELLPSDGTLVPALWVRDVTFFPSTPSGNYRLTAFVNDIPFVFRPSDPHKEVRLPDSNLFNIRFEIELDGRLSSNEIPSIRANSREISAVTQGDARGRLNAQSVHVQQGYSGTYKLYDIRDGIRSSVVRAEVSYQVRFVPAATLIASPTSAPK